MKKLLRFYVEPVFYIFAFRSTASHNMQLSNHSYRYTDWLGTKSYVPKAYVGLRTAASGNPSSDQTQTDSTGYG